MRSTPEHDKRKDGDDPEHYELTVAESYVESVESGSAKMRGGRGLYWSRKWMEEAFLAGISWRTRSTCEWSRDNIDDYYETECGRTFYFVDEGVEENGYQYCPGCGKRVWQGGGGD